MKRLHPAEVQLELRHVDGCYCSVAKTTKIIDQRCVYAYIWLDERERAVVS